MTTSIKDKTRALLDEQTRSGKHKRRKFKDKLAQYGIAIGGLSVIAAVVLICFYLLWVVLPIFKSAHIELEKDYSWAQAASQTNIESSVNLLAVEEYGEIAFSVNNAGMATFTDLQSDSIIHSESLASVDNPLVALEAVNFAGLMIASFADGSFKLIKQDYSISYPNDKRHIEASIVYPFSDRAFELADQPLTKISAKSWEDGLLVVGLGADNQVYTKLYEVEESYDEESYMLEESESEQITLDFTPSYLLTTEGPDWLYAIAKDGHTAVYRFKGGKWNLHQELDIAADELEVSQAKLLLGQSSLMIGDSQGAISQWFQVRGLDKTKPNKFSLESIRNFKLADQPITQIVPESRRKGFIATDSKGALGIFYTTSERELAKIEFGQPIANLAINARSNKLLVIGENGQTNSFEVENEHPEVSWSALWSEVWYESYEEPSFTWQSSASTNDFESKFSLVPLSFGTFKAAFYAMLFAVPLAIFGAIFTAYFMAPKMRTMVKPTVEIMEAMPTVILGFLAGLWLAPMIEEKLMGVILLIVLMPIAVILFGYGYNKIPSAIKHRIPDGWQAALLFPVVVLTTWFAFSIGAPVENALFDGAMTKWLDANGYNYDQRNSLVVGIAMGFAVIPTIFSITEDAIFSVPKHLSNGSLALGASQWQTLVRVVLPTASPGIFSALMIGLGRAVGETMIVLMATGNTPIMDMNIFEGMRTLSANIAVEMPESELGSSHYRILFLAAFVLFLFTFAFNTIAEVVRQRLRNKYGSL